MQNNVELTGPVPWIGRPPYQAHPERLPIAFQDHGNPVRFRNIWVRELGNHRHKEFMPSNALLDTYVGDYGHIGQWNGAKVRRLPDGLLSLTQGGMEVVLRVESLPDQILRAHHRCDLRNSSSLPVKQLAACRGEDESHALKMDRVISVGTGSSSGFSRNGLTLWKTGRTQVTSAGIASNIGQPAQQSVPVGTKAAFYCRHDFSTIRCIEQ